VVPRPGFRESTIMTQFVKRERLGAVIPTEVFQNGDWGACVAGLLTLPRRDRPGVNGADQAADLIVDWL
jgi:hypothetical protein